MKIAFLGPEGSYSHVAAQMFLETETSGKNGGCNFDECIPFRNLTEVVEAVQARRVEAAVLPIENSLQGGVLQAMDLLQAAENVYAVKEIVIRVDHRLVYKKGVEFSQIGRVYSHKQALAQCTEFLQKQMPFAALRETESTGFGLAKAVEDASGKSAAIVGAHTKNLRDGFVMSEASIADEKNNFTHFLLVKKGEKVFIIGANGCGKSTLIKILLGKLAATGGKIETGYNVEIGYYDQENQNLDMTKTVLDELWDEAKKEN